MQKFAIPVTFLFGILLLLNACCKDENSGPDSGGNPIEFSNMEVGQTSTYIGLLGEKYFESTTDDFVYTDDTLVLTIVDHDALGYKVAEQLRYVGDVDPWMAGEQDSTYYYYLAVKNDTLFVKPSGSAYLQSRIFSFPISETGLSLTSILSPEVQLSGWKTNLSYCECNRSGYTENYTLFGQTFDHLNVLIENSSMAFDGPGSTYVYAREHGIVRFSTYGWWTQAGYGWDLLPNE